MQLKETTAAAKELLSELPIRKPRRLKRSDVILLIASFICALILWVYIASTITPDLSPTFRDLPITVDLTNTQAERLGLMLLPESDAELQNLNVTCTIYGSRTAIGGLSRSDIEAYVDFDSDIMDMTGMQTLPIKVRRKNGSEFTNADVTPSRVTVNLDHFTKKEIPVNDVSYPNLIIDDEAIIRKEMITYSPAKIEVSGPSKQLAALDHIRVNINDAENLLESKTFDSSDCSFVDAENKELNGSGFEMASGLFSVTIQVRYSRELPVSVELTASDDFDKDIVFQRLRIIGSGNKTYSLPGYGDDNMTITVETPDIENKEILYNLKSWNSLPITLSDLTPGKTVTKTFTYATGFECPEKITSVSFKLDDTDLQTKTCWIKNSEIERQNQNDRFSYDLKSPDGTTQVTLCGTPEDLAMVESEDLKAYVNLISITEKGSESVKINVVLPDTINSVWVYKPPSIALNVKDAE